MNNIFQAFIIVFIACLVMAQEKMNKESMVREIITSINSNVSVIINAYIRLNERVKLLEQKNLTLGMSQNFTDFSDIKDSENIELENLSYSDFINSACLESNNGPLLTSTHDINNINIESTFNANKIEKGLSSSAVSDKSLLLTHDVNNNNIITSSYDVKPITSSATVSDRKKDNNIGIKTVEEKDEHSNDGTLAVSSNNNDKKDVFNSFISDASSNSSLKIKSKKKKNNKNNKKNNNNNKQRKSKYRQQRNRNKKRNKGRGKNEPTYSSTCRSSNLCQEEPPGISNGDQCGNDFVIINGKKYVEGDGTYSLWLSQNEAFGIIPDPKQQQRIIFQENDNKTFSERMGFEIDLKKLTTIYKS